MAFLDDALKTLGAIAPGIATALGGPLAGLAVRAVGEVFGLPDTADKDKVMRAVASATPEQLLALKQADQAFAIRMRELDIDIDKIAADDRKSARQREVDTGDVWTPRILAVLIVGGWLFCEWFILNYSIEASMREIVAAGLRTVDNALVMMLGYYFGAMNRPSPAK